MHSLYDWFRTHRFAVDVVAMLGLLLFSLVTNAGTGTGPVSLVVSTLLVVPLAWRRTRTEYAGIAIAIVALGQWALNIPPSLSDVAVIFIVYALAAYAPRWASIGGLVLALVGAVLLVSRFYPTEPGPASSSLLFAAVLVVLTWLLVLFAWTSGDLTRTKRLREQALEDRAHRLEIEAQHERRLAANDERAHIAREMHDIVAHSLSVIITQADGARYAAAADPSVAPAALATIAETGRSSLKEMRRLLGVLRGDEEVSTRPLPGLADLDELLLSVRAAGLPVAFDRLGEARRSLPGGAELTAYRVVQEALTNVMKHAGPRARADVSLRWGLRGLELTITDDGRGASASLGQEPATPGRNDGGSPDTSGLPSGGGNGLRGMADRLGLYDGTLSAKPLPGGGFGIRAFIPYTET